MDIPVFTGTHADFLVIVSTCFSLTPVCTMSHVRRFHPGLHHGIIFLLPRQCLPANLFSLDMSSCYHPTMWTFLNMVIAPNLHSGLVTLFSHGAQHLVFALGISPHHHPGHFTLSPSWAPHLACHFVITLVSHMLPFYRPNF